jgi:hypothetical protein
LTLRAISSNPGLIPNPTFAVLHPTSSTDTLFFTPTANSSGTATISVILSDNGGTANGGSNSIIRTFVVTVTGINQPPTINAIPAATIAGTPLSAIPENGGPQQVALTGITAGLGDVGQTITISATSSAANLIPNPTITYISPNTTGILTLTPVAYAISPTMTGTLNGTTTVTGLSSTSGLSVGDEVTGTGIPSNTTITAINATTNSITLSQAATGGTSTSTVTSTLTFSPTITVVVHDNGGTDNGGIDTTIVTFPVTVIPVNQPPTIDAIPNPAAITENTSATQTVQLTGITGGIGDAGNTQNLVVTATTNNTALIGTPTVNYTYPASGTTGSISYTLQPNQSGTATVTVTVTDTSSITPTHLSTTQSFTVTVTPVNQAPPTPSFTGTTSVLENAGPTTLALTGIMDGPGDAKGQTLTITATSSNPAIIPNPVVTYTSPNSSGTLTYTPVPFTSTPAGQSVTITVVVTDSGSTANGGVVKSLPLTIPIQVTAVNQQPTLDPLASVGPLPANPPAQTITLTGIGPGTGDAGQTLTVTAQSSNTAVVANPLPVTYPFSGDPTKGQLTFTPVSGAMGVTTITVVVQDSGGTANNGINFIARTFTVAVNPPHAAPVVTSPETAALAYTQNQAPTVIDPGLTVTDSNSATLVGAKVQIVNINNTNTLNPSQDVLGFTGQSGITGSYNASAGILTLSGTASVAAYQSVLRSVTYFNSSTFPTPLQRTISFTVDDGASINSVGSATRGGPAGPSIVITPVNHAPTLGPLTTITPAGTITINPNSTLPLLENSGPVTINLSGITDGEIDNNAQLSNQSVTATVTSSNTALITNLAVSYTSPNTTGTLTFQPGQNQVGVATITITVMDNGGVANNGVNTVSQSFTVDVGAVNQAPTLDAIMLNGSNALTLNESATPVPVTVPLTGITAGPGQSNEVVTVTATSSNPNVIPNPVVAFPNPSTATGPATDSFTFTPAQFASGTATITVSVMNNGGIANGGVDTIKRTFTVTVQPVTQPPTLNAITPNNITVKENQITTANPVTVNLMGITAGQGNPGLTVQTVSAKSSNTSIIPDPAITYPNPNTPSDPTTALLTLVPRQFASTPAGQPVTITVTVTNGGSTANSGVNSVSQTFTVTVTPVNQQPTLNTITPQTVNENAGAQSIPLTGISAGQGDTGQTLSFTATSSNTSVIPVPTFTYPYNGSSASGLLTFTPAPNTSTPTGQPVTITVFLMDNGGTANGGIDTIQQSFTVAVQAINQTPTLNPITNTDGTNTFTLLENASPLSVDLNNITAGPGDTNQTLTVTATSSNTAVIPNPTVNYTSPNATGFLTITPVPFTSTPTGTPVTITVFVMDNGGTLNGAVDHIQQTFNVVVLPVNQQPTLNPIPNPATLLENAPLQTVSLSGITAGKGDNAQLPNLTVTASSSNSTLIPNPITVNYPNGTDTTSGSLSFTPAAGQFGTATITVTVDDHGGTDHGGVESVQQMFTVTVLRVNQPPTLNAIANPTPILENAGQQTVTLSGISAGNGDSDQTVHVTATSTNTGLIPNLTVNYPNPATPNDLTSGTLTFTPAPGASGSAVITVVVKDTGGVANGGVDTVFQSFTVTVLGVNQAPTLDPISDKTIGENAAQQTVNLTGISNGTGNPPGQTLTVTATSSNTALIPDPTVTILHPTGSTDSLTFTPVMGQFGSALITVTITNGGSTANGGGNSVIQTFTVNVTKISQPPTLNAITVSPTILENSTVPVVVNLAGITDGNNNTETVTVTASSSNTQVIGIPTVSYISGQSSGSIALLPVHNAVGSATITVTVTNSGGSSVSQNFTASVQPVNQQPSFTVSNPTVTVNENSGPQTVLNYALFNPGGGPNELNQTATYIITAISNPTLFDTAPSVSATGTLTYTPAPNASGSSTVTLEVMDNGGTASGGVNLSVPQTFTITVNTVNQAPSFVKGPNETVPENAGAQSVATWATSISPGPAGEASQTVNFIVTNNDSALFSVQPAISPSGTLTYTPAQGVSGTATVTVTLHDNGGTANGGVDTSPPQLFTITVTPVVATPQIMQMAPVSFTSGAAGNVVVAMFSVVGGGPASDYIAHINWGDGTAQTDGTVILDTPATATTPATYSVVGSHVYTASGAFTITVTILNRNGGATVNATSVAVATATGGSLSAQLSPASNNGPAHNGITNVANPTIIGTTVPGAKVTLSEGSSVLATATADASGNFSLTSTSLPDGTHNFTVTSTPSTSGAASTSTTVGPVVIDTKAPRVSSVTLNPKTGQILITFTDVGAGLDLSSLTNRLSYRLAGKVTNVTAISSPSGAVTSETVTLSTNGKKIKAGSIVLTLDALGVNVVDQAGNALAPTFISTPPGGNGVPTGPLSLKFTIKNGKVVVPKAKKAVKPKALSLPAGPARHGLH